MNPRPCSPDDAVLRATRLAEIDVGQYVLGTGDYRPGPGGDSPWTERDGLVGCDCAGLIVWAFTIPRHRPGYNRGGAYDVEDDINSNSMLGDAAGAQDLFRAAVDVPQPGDVIAYPTIRIKQRAPSLPRGATWNPPIPMAPPPPPPPDLVFVGHVALVVGAQRALDVGWDMSAPRWHLLDIVQVCGPNGRKPAAIKSDGAVFDHHDSDWHLPEHRSFLLRTVQ